MSMLLETANMTVPAVLGSALGFLLGTYRERRLEKRREQKEDNAQFEYELQRPRLVTQFDPMSKECVTPWTYEHQPCPTSATTIPKQQTVEDCYVSVFVINVGKNVCRKCKGYLTYLQKEEGGNWVPVPIQGRHELVWSFAEEIVDLPPRSSKPLNLLHLDGRSSSLRLTIASGLPAFLENAVSAPGKYLLTVGIAGENVDSQEITIGVDWDGTWNGQWKEGTLWAEERD